MEPISLALLSAVTEAVFAHLVQKTEPRLRDWLGRDPARLAFQRALAGAYVAFVRQYPEYAAALFDETFLKEQAAPELAKLLTRHEYPDPARLAILWQNQFSHPPNAAVLTAPAADFLRWLEAEAKMQPPLQPLFDSRALERLHDVAERMDELQADLHHILQEARQYTVTIEQAQGIVIGDRVQVTQIFNSYFDSNYAALDELYRRPEGVFQRVRLEHFTGREWLEGEIDRFLDGHDRGAFLLEGEAGVGKTTFLAHLVQARRYIHFFAEQAPGESGIEVALQSLCSQLVSRYRLEPHHIRGAFPQALVRYPPFLETLLRQAAEDLSAGEKVVIVVDALDEAGTLPGHNVLGLPCNLPRGVYFILSARPIAVSLRMEPYPYKVELRTTGPENLADMRRYLDGVVVRSAVAGQVQAQGSSAQQFVETLLEKSRGNWMYLHYVVDDIESGQRASLDLEQLPMGLVSYYAEYWGRWRDKPEWNTLYAPLLATLAAAQEAIDLKRLTTWSSTTATQWALRRLLDEEWRAFLFVTDGVYRLYHASLRDFLSGRLDTDALAARDRYLADEMAERTRLAHGHIADYYRMVCDGEWSRLVKAHGDYPFHHLSAHLSAAHEWSTLYQLTEDPEWYAASRIYDPSRRSYALDVERAIEAAETAGPDGLPRVVAYSLLYATLSTFAANIPPETLEMMVRLGQEKRALGYAELVSEPEKQADIYRRIGSASWMQGEAHLAREALAHALDVTERIEDKRHKVEVLVEVAQVLVGMGEIDQVRQVIVCARATAEEIRDTRHKVEALVKVAQVLMAGGDMEQALHMLACALTATKAIKWKEAKIKALGNVAQALEGIGEEEQARRVLARALSMAEGIRDDKTKAETLSYLGEVLAGEAEEEQAHQALAHALAAAEGIPNGEDKATALSKVARALARVGEHEQARNVLDHALIIAEGVKDLAEQVYTLDEVRETLVSVAAQEGQSGRALAIAEEIAEPRVREHALEAVAHALIRSKEFDRAQVVAEGIWDMYSKARALTSVARALLEIGNERSAKDILDDALSTTEKVEHISTATLQSMARAMSGIGQYTSALDTIEWVSGYGKSDVLATVAREMLGTGKMKELPRILAMANEIDWHKEKAQAFLELAEILVEVGESEMARETLLCALSAVEMIEESFDIIDSKEELRLRTGKALVKLGDRERAKKVLSDTLDTAKDMEDSWVKGRVLTSAVEVMTQLGDVDGLNCVLTDAKMMEARARAEVYLSVAKALAQIGQEEQVKGILDHVLSLIEEVEELELWDAEWREHVLTRVVLELTELGDVDSAIGAAGRTWWRGDRIWEAIFSKAREMGKLESALDVIRRVKDERQKTELLMNMVKSIITQREGDRTIAISALRITERIKVEDAKDMPDAVILKAWLLALTEGADQAIEQLDHVLANLREYKQIEVLSVLAQALAQVGEQKQAQEVLTRALLTFESMEENVLGSKGRALTNVAQALVRVKDRAGVACALVAANKAELGWYETEVLSILAQVLAELEDFEGALAAAERAREKRTLTEGGRSTTLDSVAQALADVTAPGDDVAVALVHRAFRYARTQDRESAWTHITAFAPVLAALGSDIITETWQQIQAIERLVGSSSMNTALEA